MSPKLRRRRRLDLPLVQLAQQDVQEGGDKPAGQADEEDLHAGELTSKQVPSVRNHVRPAAQLKLCAADLRIIALQAEFRISQKSTKITAPIGISTMPYRATKSSNFMAMPGTCRRPSPRR